MLTSLFGCAIPEVRCPGEPLEYVNTCGKLDPVTKEQVLR